MRGVVWAVVLWSAPVAAAELSVEAGRYGVGGSEDRGQGDGTVLRVGLAGTRRPGELVEFAVEGRWGSADALDGGPAGAGGWAGVSLRYLRFVPAATRAQPFVGLGFDLGSDLRGPRQALEVSSPSLSGHLALGLRLPLSERWAVTTTVVAGLDGAAVPWVAAMVGGTWAVDL